jgi:hypothetical protein
MTDRQQGTANQRTVLTDIEIPFGRLIVIFIKFGLASIPAAIVLMIIFMVIGLILTAIFGVGFMTMWGPRVGTGI